MGGTGPAGILALADVLFSSMIGVPERLKRSLPSWFEPVTGMGRPGFLFARKSFHTNSAACSNTELLTLRQRV
jgi:hypothetical protein